MQLRSILKPAVPLTPPKVIPSFDELRQRSTRKRSPAKSGAEELLIDFSTPAPTRQNASEATVSGAENVMDPFSPTKGQPVAHTQEEDRQEEERRQAEKQAILDRRAERRKSMANRRVSFAPEATLHTWSVMELGEDSTTSSASTRRQSSMTAQATPRQPSSSDSPASGRPATPPEQVEEPQVVSSPAHQRDLHQRKRRRSSTGPAAQLEGSLDEVFSSSPSVDIHTESSPVRIDDSVGSDSDEDTDGDTAMSMAESTSHSLGSENSTSSQTSLDDRLRQAASQAGTRGIDYDENGDDISMEMAEDTVTNAFKPWAKQQSVAQSEALEDQKNINPSRSALGDVRDQAPDESDDNGENEDTQDMSMDVTNAMGGILAKNSRRKSVANTRRRSSVARRRSSGGESSYGDDSMDFTAVNGGILSKQQAIEDEGTSDEDMTMEFTNVVGSGLAHVNQDFDDDNTEATGLMDITSALGGILPPIEEQTEPQTDVEDDQTMAMEMTRAVGGIMPSQPIPDDPTTQMDLTRAVGGILASRATPEKTQAKQLMQEETDAGQLSVSPAAVIAPPTPKSTGPLTSIASETGSPDLSLKPRLSGRSRQASNGPSTTPKFSPRRPSPAKGSPMKATKSTPTKQLTPLPSQSEKPNRTPVNPNVAQRSASPKRLFKDEIRSRDSPATAQKPGLFSHDESTGRHTPSVVLNAKRPQPPRRRSSGVGIDQQGFGSPQVAKLLERRSSISDAAPVFELNGKPKSKLRFEDPQELEREVDADRAEQERRESGRFIMEQEANMQQEENATMQLSQMIESMTPKKEKASKLKGRKSLAVGGARGLLGKRPAELDLEEADSPESPKRLKAMEREASPVKKVHLPKPPSKEETTGRLTRAEQRRLQQLSFTESTTPAASPSKKSAASPHVGSRYHDVPLSKDGTRPESFVEKLDNVVGAVDVSTEHADEGRQEKISLQDFLNMTNIHFIELSTTKRRHTQAPIPQRPSQEQQDKSTEAQFAAAATTLPLLELYQHATRELKSYISTGRKIIRSIEAETLNEQPQLFKEYVDARPDIKAVMDNQFRNGKTNARLQSKEGWYSWRSQLVEGLRSGLEGIKRGMQKDAAQLDEQQSSLDEVLPDLAERRATLGWELASLKQSLDELDSLDTEALDKNRRQLRALDQENDRKAALLESLRQQMSEKEETLASAEELKSEMNAQVEEAERVREEYRGWPVADVLAQKEKVNLIEKTSGWRLVAAEEDEDDPNDFGVALTLSFKNELRLFFYPAAFEMASTRRRSSRKSKSVSGPSAPLSLTYTPVDAFGDVLLGKVLATEKRFFLQLIRSQLHGFAMMPKGSVPPKTLLETISRGWQLANRVSEEVRLLKMMGVTSAQIQGDEKLGVLTKLMLPQQSRIDVEFTLGVTPLNDGGMASSTSVTAKGIYGRGVDLLNGSRGRKVEAALGKELESRELGQGGFIGAVHAFEQWLASQAERKTEKQAPVQQAQENVASKGGSAPVQEQKQEAPAPRSAAASEPEPDAVPPTSAKELRRSPLAPKTANIPAKLTAKKLPVPSKRFTLANKASLPTTGAAEPDKENATVIVQKQVQQTQTPTKQLQLEAEMYAPPEATKMDIDASKPAIPPEMQEQMMPGSPFRRRGALRRSPM